jgi:hypothetical protein
MRERIGSFAFRDSSGLAIHSEARIYGDFLRFTEISRSGHEPVRYGILQLFYISLKLLSESDAYLGNCVKFVLS